VRAVFCFFFFFILVFRVYAFSFVVFGDNRDGDKTFQALIARVNQERGIIFAVNTGDFVSHGRANEYAAYQQMISKLKVPIYNVLGNHDGVGGGWRIFQKLFGALYYSFDYEGSHFVILNNAFRESFDREQFEWLKNDLAGSKAKFKFVFMHRPTFDPSEIYKSHIMSGRAVTEALMKVFQKYRVDYVFAGHIHGYAKAEKGGVTYIVTGGAGAPLHLPPDFGGYYHYVRVDVDDRKIQDAVVRID
jgi:3',5'-cyclic AMP phosphodiesterase CpdA